MDFYHYKVVVYTHCQHTLQFKLHVKVNFASNDPFNQIISIKLAKRPNNNAESSITLRIKVKKSKKKFWDSEWSEKKVRGSIVKSRWMQHGTIKYTSEYKLSIHHKQAVINLLWAKYKQSFQTNS